MSGNLVRRLCRKIFVSRSYENSASEDCWRRPYDSRERDDRHDPHALPINKAGSTQLPPTPPGTTGLRPCAYQSFNPSPSGIFIGFIYR